MDDDLPPYSLPDPAGHPADIAARVMMMPEHRHLIDNDIDFGWLMRRDEKISGGRYVLGSVHEPTCQGSMAPVFEWMLETILRAKPRFLVILDLAYWEAATPRQREILVFHELMHVRQKLDRYGAPRFDKDGLPVYGLFGHDVEEFTAVVARYGAHKAEIEEFVRAVNTHNQN